jgi:phosphonate transport system ATP-binding protein
MVTVSGLTKRYADETALSGVSFDLQPGELTVLVGRSGAGKTTLLRCIDGLEQPDSGTVEYGGEPLASTDVALVFQSGALVDSKSVFANVLDGSLGRIPAWRELVGWYPPSEKRAAIRRLHDVGLAGYAQRRVGALSGGQRQRVGIARGLQQEPMVLLADEPVASLDPATGRSVLDRLAAAVREQNLVGLVSLHQPRLAEAVADRYLGLADGELVLDTPAAAVTPDDLTEVYADE